MSDPGGCLEVHEWQTEALGEMHNGSLDSWTSGLPVPERQFKNEDWFG